MSYDANSTHSTKRSIDLSKEVKLPVLSSNKKYGLAVTNITLYLALHWFITSHYCMVKEAMKDILISQSKIALVVTQHII